MGRGILEGDIDRQDDLSDSMKIGLEIDLEAGGVRRGCGETEMTRGKGKRKSKESEEMAA